MGEVSQLYFVICGAADAHQGWFCENFWENLESQKLVDFLKYSKIGHNVCVSKRFE